MNVLTLYCIVKWMSRCTRLMANGSTIPTWSISKLPNCSIFLVWSKLKARGVCHKATTLGGSPSRISSLRLRGRCPLCTQTLPPRWWGSQWRTRVVIMGMRPNQDLSIQGRASILLPPKDLGPARGCPTPLVAGWTNRSDHMSPLTVRVTPRADSIPSLWKGSTRPSPRLGPSLKLNQYSRNPSRK